MAEEKKKSFTGILIMLGIILVLSYIAGVIIDNKLMGNPVSFKPNAYFFIIFLAGAMCYIIYATGDNDKYFRLKGKSSMENQHWATRAELDKNFKHCKFTDLKNMDIQGVPFRFQRIGKNLLIHFTPPCHVLIVGASGTGKTACWVEPCMQILSELKTKPSFFVTDPKGEIYGHHSLKLQNQGYVVLQLDLTQPYASKRWNPLENIYIQWQKRLHLEEEILKHTNDPIKNYPNLLKGGEIDNNEWYEFMGKAFPTLRETLIEVDVEKQKIKDDCME
ncbi:MAG: type IV secretory system conjugative DNA transfer family protein, partial [Clostridia bacterium]|nr:type IV secretory system conjugative DNA transfer family protein [Clostridia bacterium]